MIFYCSIHFDSPKGEAWVHLLTKKNERGGVLNSMSFGLGVYTNYFLLVVDIFRR